MFALPRMGGALLGLWIFLDVVEAWPSSMSCDYTCVASKSPGGAFGGMQGIPNYGPAPTGANCQITTNIPAGGYTSGATYNVMVASTKALARKLTSNVAGFGGSGTVNAASKVTSSSHQWTATSASSASFKALCGAGGTTDEMWVSDTVSFSLATPTTEQPTTTTTEALTTTTTEALTTTTNTESTTTNTATTTTRATTTGASESGTTTTRATTMGASDTDTTTTRATTTTPILDTTTPPTTTTPITTTILATETITGFLTFTSSTLTKSQVETSSRKALALEFGVAESRVQVAVVESRRLETSGEPRMLAGNWEVSFSIVVPSSDAAAARNKVSAIATDPTSLNQKMKTQLQALGVSAADAAIEVSVQVGSATTTPKKATTSAICRSSCPGCFLFLIALMYFHQ